MPKAAFISTEDLRPNPLEKVTQGRPVIDTNHGQVHAGNGFSVFARISSLGNNNSEEFALTIPANNYVHFQVAELTGNGSADVDIFKLATLTKGAAVMAPANRHHIINSASALTFSNVSAVSDDGTQFEGFSIYGSTANARGGTGVVADSNEWVFTPGEYLFRVTSRVTSLDAILRLFWYEEAGA